jgi:chemotaxis signal transduction protein
MFDPLARFRDEPGEVSEAAAGTSATLLLYEHDEELVGIDASLIDAVIPWRAPAPLPCSHSWFVGVVQDRGRIVPVLDATRTASTRPPQRIVVCTTPRGLVGLPAHSTRGVSVVLLASEPTSGMLVDSDTGPIKYVSPTDLVERALGSS